jgi:antitoxin MazE
MRTKLVPIGNSRGVRLPKAVIEQCGLSDDVELELHGDHIRLRAPSAPRAGWDAAFKRMRARGDDRLIDADASAPPTFDRSEWRW